MAAGERTFDRIKETSTTTGTGTITLGGAVTGFRTFASVMTNADFTYFCIEHQSDGSWEVNSGTFTSAGATLSRATPTASSNGGALVNFAAGTKHVFLVCSSTILRYIQDTQVAKYFLASPTAANGQVLPRPIVVADLPAQQYICLRDEKTAGTNGGTYTTGAWQTRDLNVEASDVAGLCSLSGNQFTLTAGTYNIRARVPGYRVSQWQSRLRNVTDSTTVLVGSSCYSEGAYNVTGFSFVEGRFTIAASKALEIQMSGSATVATQGCGVCANQGITEVYTVVELWKDQ
jgi:hypothetical protein